MDMSIVFSKQFVFVSAVMSHLGIQIGTPGKRKLSLQIASIRLACGNVGSWACFSDY